MVNQSKSKDPRFWNRWKNAGAVETVEDACERSLYFGKYIGEVGFVRDGLITHESDARELAREHGFPLQLLERVLKIGANERYQTLLRHVRGSICSEYYREEAERHAAKYDLPLEPLKEALLGSRSKKTSVL